MEVILKDGVAEAMEAAGVSVRLLLEILDDETTARSEDGEYPRTFWVRYNARGYSFLIVGERHISCHTMTVYVDKP